MFFQLEMFFAHELGDIIDLSVSLRWDIDAEEGIHEAGLDILEAI